MSTDLTFITNESGKSLHNRFGVLFGNDTRLFDCLVGYFFISGFHKLHPALIKTDGMTYELLHRRQKGSRSSFARNAVRDREFHRWAAGSEFFVMRVQTTAFNESPLTQTNDAH